MKKIIVFFIAISVLFSCGKKETGNMIVNGNIDGLKKGTLYLQKMKDSVLVSVDSVQLNGEGVFTLVDHVESPEIYLLQLDKLEDKVIRFFGENGEITITSKLPKFAFAAKITGSENQKIFEEHQAMARKFNGKQLDLIKEKFEAQKENDTALIAKIEKEEDGLLKRNYLYTINFAINHSKNEVAPYLALTELYYANIKYLDTVNNSLSKKVKSSKYGLELQEFIQNIKKNEK
jgi:hypothetical protein